ncbi:MAG: argininosuccinate lyase [bacterium]
MKKKSTGKLWSGRFDGETAGSVEAFTESVSDDARLAEWDVRAGRAHAEGLYGAGVLKKSEWRLIDRGLADILDEIRAGRFRFRPELEDVHMNVERRLHDKIGAVAGKLHTARSRNDLVAADLRLYLMDAAGRICAGLTALQAAVVKKAEDHLGALMPGYTHLQRAQPVLFSHHMMAYHEMFGRDRERFTEARDRMDVSPLGSCALSGTALAVDWEQVAERAGFSKTARNSIDAVSDRDFALEFLAAASITMVHLSRLADEIVIWSSAEFGFISLPDRLCTGSSIMPHKKNPDVAELIRAKSGRVAGSLVGALMIMKGLPLSYNRDLQEDKRNAFDAADTVTACLEMARHLVEGMELNEEAMERAARGGFAASVDLVDYLVGKGLPFREAHFAVGRLVRHCERKGAVFADLSLDEFRKHSPLFGADVTELLKAERSVDGKVSPGSTATREVLKNIRRAKAALRGKS